MSIAQVQEQLIGYLTPRPPKTRSTEFFEQEGHKILKMESPTAYGLFRGCLAVLGENFVQWEPESTWMVLTRHGYDLNHDERDKIMAAMTVLLDTSYFYDFQAFNAMCVGLNDDEVTPDTIVPIAPPLISWSIIEIQAMLGDFKNNQVRPDLFVIPKYDWEITQFIAANLKNSGYVLAPIGMEFAQESLDELNKNTADISPTVVSEALDKLSDTPFNTIEIDEDPYQIQIARHIKCYAYIQDRIEQSNQEESLVPR